jgi:hypothetical protein
MIKILCIITLLKKNVIKYFLSLDNNKKSLYIVSPLRMGIYTT